MIGASVMAALPVCGVERSCVIQLLFLNRVGPNDAGRFHLIQRGAAGTRYPDAVAIADSDAVLEACVIIELPISSDRPECGSAANRLRHMQRRERVADGNEIRESRRQRIDERPGGVVIAREAGLADLYAIMEIGRAHV